MINVNYNLLKILGALLTEVHVTNASKKLHLTQAATSNALAQLREIFNDPLLTRGQGSKMYLTPLAKSLKPKVAIALEQVQTVFDQNCSFEPINSEQVFQLGMSDYIESIILNKLIRQFYKRAPNARLVIHHLNYLEDEKLLEHGELDLVFGNFPLSEDKLNKSKLFVDNTCFFVRKNHPILAQNDLSFNELKKYPLITVNYADKPRSNYLAQLLQNAQSNLHVNITVPHAQNVINNVLDNDYIAYSAIKLAEPYLLSKKITPLHPKKTPQALINNQFSVYVYWHKNLENNQANIWLREMVKNLFFT